MTKFSKGVGDVEGEQCIGSVSARARFLRSDPVKSSVDVTGVSQCVFHHATKLPSLRCLKNPANTQLSLKRAWDISAQKYTYRSTQVLLIFLHLIRVLVNAVCCVKVRIFIAK